VAAAEVVPLISQHLQVFTDDALNSTQFLTAEAVVVGQGYVRVKLKLGAPLFAIYVHVSWFSTIV
jgi:hypothetical protein